MWAIQIVDGKRGIIYLREALLDGRILLFDKEEVVLRFMAVFKDKVETALGVRLPKRITPTRFRILLSSL